MRPTKEELNKKIWYRLFKVVSALLLIGAFIAPWIIHKPNVLLFIDSLINLAVWFILIFIGRALILYILYGKKEVSADEKSDFLQWIIWGFVFFAFLGLMALLLSPIFGIL